MYNVFELNSLLLCSRQCLPQRNSRNQTGNAHGNCSVHVVVNTVAMMGAKRKSCNLSTFTHDRRVVSNGPAVSRTVPTSLIILMQAVRIVQLFRIYVMYMIVIRHDAGMLSTSSRWMSHPVQLANAIECVGHCVVFVVALMGVACDAPSAWNTFVRLLHLRHCIRILDMRIF